MQAVAGPSNGINQAQARLSLVTTAGSSSSGGRKVSGTGTSFKPETAQERKRSNVGSGIGLGDDKKPEIWLEVSDQVIEALELDHRKAIEERVRIANGLSKGWTLIEQDNRRAQLVQDFFELRWLHIELGLPPLPTTASQHHFPPDLLPDRSKEETPGAYQNYERLLARFMLVNKDMAEEGEIEERGLEDVQPEVGLINWMTEIFKVVSTASSQETALGLR